MEALVEPVAKIACTDVAALPPLNIPWRFVTMLEGGRLDIVEWDPRTATHPRNVARAFIRAYNTSRRKDTKYGETLFYFDSVIEWHMHGCVRDDKESPPPAEFKHVREDAQLTRVHEPRTIFDEYFYRGPMLFYLTRE